MGTLQETLSGIIPIIALIVLGAVLRRLGLLDDLVVEGLKRLVVSVVLPAVLFIAFLSMEVHSEHLALIALVFVTCVALLLLGMVGRRAFGWPAVAPFLFTGFEFGMVGLALFTAAYGADEVSAAAIVDLGQELFIWFVFVTLLNRQVQGQASLLNTLNSFVRSPVIIAIIAGLVLNALDLHGPLLGSPFGFGLLQTLEYLAAVIVPIMLMIIGYGTKLTVAGSRAALPFVAARYATTLALALVLSEGIAGHVLGLGPTAQAAVFMLFILPPPFIVPIFLPRDRADDTTFTSNVLSLYTPISVLTFLAYVLITAA